MGLTLLLVNLLMVYGLHYASSLNVLSGDARPPSTLWLATGRVQRSRYTPSLPCLRKMSFVSHSCVGWTNFVGLSDPHLGRSQRNTQLSRLKAEGFRGEASKKRSRASEKRRNPGMRPGSHGLIRDGGGFLPDNRLSISIKRYNKKAIEALQDVIQSSAPYYGVEAGLIEGLCVTEVRATSDLREATVFISVAGGHDAKREAMLWLKRNATGIRLGLAKRFRTRKRVPYLYFRLVTLQSLGELLRSSGTKEEAEIAAQLKKEFADEFGEEDNLDQWSNEPLEEFRLSQIPQHRIQRPSGRLLDILPGDLQGHAFDSSEEGATISQLESDGNSSCDLEQSGEGSVDSQSSTITEIPKLGRIGDIYTELGDSSPTAMTKNTNRKSYAESKSRREFYSIHGQSQRAIYGNFSTIPKYPTHSVRGQSRSFHSMHIPQVKSFLFSFPQNYEQSNGYPLSEDESFMEVNDQNLFESLQRKSHRHILSLLKENGDSLDSTGIKAVMAELQRELASPTTSPSRSPATEAGVESPEGSLYDHIKHSGPNYESENENLHTSSTGGTPSHSEDDSSSHSTMKSREVACSLLGEGNPNGNDCLEATSVDSEDDSNDESALQGNDTDMDQMEKSPAADAFWNAGSYELKRFLKALNNQTDYSYE